MNLSNSVIKIDNFGFYFVVSFLPLRSCEAQPCTPVHFLIFFFKNSYSPFPYTFPFHIFQYSQYENDALGTTLPEATIMDQIFEKTQ